MNKLLNKIKQMAFNASEYSTQNWGTCHKSYIIEDMLKLLHKETGVKVNFTYAPGNAWVPDSSMCFSIEGYTSTQAKKAYNFIEDYWHQWEKEENYKLFSKVIFNGIERSWECAARCYRRSGGKIKWDLITVEGIQKVRLGKYPNEGTIKYLEQDNAMLCKAYGVSSLEELVAKAKEILG